MSKKATIKKKRRTEGLPRKAVSKKTEVGFDPRRYAYRVIWSEEDGEFVGLCAEFPSLSWLENDQVKALDGIVSLVRGAVEDMTASREEIPEPLSLKSYSGKFVTRVPPELHRRLMLRAAEEGKSMNSLVSSILAHGGS